MAKEKQKIVCDYGVGIALAGDFGITVQAVSRALNFKSNSLQAKEIRKKAMKKYKGTEVTSKKSKVVAKGKNKIINN